MYGKIWMSLFEGSLYAAGWEAIFTFMILITFANKKGEVQMSLDHLSGRTNVPKEILEKGISALMEPDPESKSKSDDGRRIVLMDESITWGWRIVNYEMYAKARDMEAIRQYWAEEKRKRAAG
jgi:hypothetical protein